MEELPCESKLLILDWRHIVSAHYYWLSTVSFLLNLRWKSYRFYLWILLIKYVFFPLFLQALLQICRGINCAVTYQSAVQFTGLIFFQLTLHNYEVFWFIYIHSALHIRWCWCSEILASFLFRLLDLGNFIGIANCSYECYSYLSVSLFLFIYCPSSNSLFRPDVSSTADFRVSSSSSILLLGSTSSSFWDSVLTLNYIYSSRLCE
jgi:hypothetical protein